MRRDGTFQGTTSAADPSYQDDLEEFDAGIDDCMQVCQSESSRTAYMRTWRLWVAFNVLNLGLCMRSSWRVYELEPGSRTRRRDERDVMRFAMLLAKRFRNSNTAAQGISMLRTVHKVRSGQALCPPQESHQLSATLRGLSDMFPSVPRDRFPVTVQYIERWSKMYRWRTRELINIWCCFLCMFVGLMRAAEALCVNKTFNPATDLSRAHVIFCPANKAPPDYCMLNMVKKKTNGTGNDRHSKRTPLFFKYNETAVVNPCRELFWMFTEGDPVPDDKLSTTPLFRDIRSGGPLRYVFMLHMLRTLLGKLDLGISVMLFALHSFRIGGATAALKAGCPQLILWALGRWGSDCGKLYTRADMNDAMDWLDKISQTHVEAAEVTALVNDVDMGDPVIDRADSAIETELRAFAGGQ